MDSMNVTDVSAEPVIVPDIPVQPNNILPHAFHVDHVTTIGEGVGTVTEVAIIIPDMGAFHLPSALSTLAEQFLNEHTGGFTVAHARTLSFETLTIELRNKRLIKQIRDMIQHIHARAFLRHHTVPDAAPLTVSARIIAAAFMIYLHHTKVFEVTGETETKLLESATALLIAFEEIVQRLSVGVRFNDLDVELTARFPGIVTTYLNDFNAWKVPDMAKLKRRIANALNVLIDLAETPVSMDTALGTQLQIQIAQLRARLQKLAGDEGVQEFESDRLTRSIPNSPFVSTTANFIFANEQLAHELLVNPNFQLLETGVFEIDRVSTLSRRVLHDEFWSDLALDFDRSDYLNVYLALGNMCKTLLETLQSMSAGETTTLLLTEISDLLDIDRIQTGNYLSQWSNCVELVTKLVNVIMRVLHPPRELDLRAEWAVLQIELADNNDEPGTVFCSALRLAFTYSEHLRLDAANTRLRLIAPLIQEHGVSYEQGKLQDKLNSGSLTLARTKAFLKPQLDELKLSKFVQLSSPKGDDALLRILHRSALVNLINPPLHFPLPEVLLYDESRLKRFSRELTRLTDASIVMRVICSFAPESDSPLLQSDIGMQQEIERVLEVTSEAVQPVSLLCSISDMVLAHSPSCIEEVEILLGFIEQTKLQKILTPESMLAMHVQLLKVFETDFDVRATVTKRVQLYLKDFSPLEADTDPLHSVYTIGPFITQLARDLHVFATLNLQIHTPVFYTVIKQVAKDAAGLPADPSATAQLTQMLQAQTHLAQTLEVPQAASEAANPQQ